MKNLTHAMKDMNITDSLKEQQNPHPHVFNYSDKLGKITQVQ